MGAYIISPLLKAPEKDFQDRYQKEVIQVSTYKEWYKGSVSLRYNCCWSPCGPIFCWPMILDIRPGEMWAESERWNGTCGTEDKERIRNPPSDHRTDSWNRNNNPSKFQTRRLFFSLLREGSSIGCLEVSYKFFVFLHNFFSKFLGTLCVMLP